MTVRLPKLDERLQAAYDLFTACDLGADIGADHGRLSCCLLSSGKCARMVVSDVSDDSLEKARRLLHLHGLEERADYRVADGLFALRQPVQCAAICGMGGRLVAHILQSGAERLQGAELVLSCHTDIPLLRRTVVEIGYRLTHELVARAGRRFYIVMKAAPGQEKYTEKELYLGPVLLRERTPLFMRYLGWREGVVACERGHEKELEWIREELRREDDSARRL